MAASVLSMLAVVVVCYMFYRLARAAARSEFDMTINIIDFHRSELRRQSAAM